MPYRMEANRDTTVISFRNADIANGENTVIYGLDMDIHKGDFVYIIGKVGSGKTSIIRTMIAENPLQGGEAEVCGFDLRRIREKDIPYLRRRMGVVFQDFQLLMDRSVEENLSFVLKATGWKDSRQIGRRISEVLEAVGMSHKAHKMPHQLSGGEQQRIAIARSLLNSPEVIVADEPTGNLDPETAEGIMALLTGINKESDTAVVMVTHNRSIVEKYPGRVFLCAGEECKEITPAAEAAVELEKDAESLPQSQDTETTGETSAEHSGAASAESNVEAPEETAREVSVETAGEASTEATGKTSAEGAIKASEEANGETSEETLAGQEAENPQTDSKNE